MDILQLHRKESDHSLLTIEEELRVAQQLPSASARETLVLHNLRLAWAIAKRHQGQGLELEDLIQEGYTGLLIAADKFDWRRGVRFATYATWWIRHEVGRAIADKGRGVRLPNHLYFMLGQLHRTIADLEQHLGRVPTAKEVALRLGWPHKKVDRLWYLNYATHCDSLDRPTEVDNQTLGDSVPGSDMNMDEMVAAMSDREVIEKALNAVSPRRAEILRMRFGLIDGKKWKLRELAELYGTSKQAIQQAESIALKQLRDSGYADALRALGES